MDSFITEGGETFLADSFVMRIMVKVLACVGWLPIDQYGNLSIAF